MTCSVVLGACSPSGDFGSSGRIELQYAGISSSDVIVWLINRSDRPIHVRTDYKSPVGVVTWPGVAQIQCESSKPPMVEQPFEMADGTYTSSEVAPGQRLRLKIDTTVPQQYRGGLCRLTLTLEDRTIVGPLEFQP